VQNCSHCYFHFALEFDTPTLAHMLNSLVRVSRRGEENHLALAQSGQIFPSNVNNIRGTKFIPTKYCYVRNSVLSASQQENGTGLSLVSFASLSAISGTF
jgi:hypothetical protein